ncbi:hypothetical protein [Spiroplasma endosymbiont of Acasis viretata]|uniref:hypothetical protein n=1 Tax=Spiroplasma endosymbiont of Acasis viretata TaxID=3066306 RepID=UPI00313DD7C0
MPIKNEILQNLEAKSEENVKQKPTKWKEFKTKHRTTAKIIKVTKGVATGAAVGALYINPIAQMSGLVAATVPGGVSAVSNRSEEQLETDIITAATSAAAIGGIANAVITCFYSCWCWYCCCWWCYYFWHRCSKKIWWKTKKTNWSWQW